jgi:hypothetical protein
MLALPELNFQLPLHTMVHYISSKPLLPASLGKIFVSIL